MLLRILENHLCMEKDLLTTPVSFLKQEFLASTQRMYSAELASVDFLRASEEARKTINEWVKGQTGGERGRRWPSAGSFLPSAHLSPCRGPSPSLASGPDPGVHLHCPGQTAFKHRNLSKWKRKHGLIEGAKSFFSVSSPDCA